MSNGTEDYRSQPDRGTVTRTWLAENNEIAARIPRGKSTPKTRLAVAAREYQIAAEALGNNLDPAVMAEIVAEEEALGVTGRSFPWLRWNRKHEELYAAGRVLEHAIQEARFGRVTGNCGSKWTGNLRRIP